MCDDVIACPRCGVVGGRSDRFCRHCGVSLDHGGHVREYRHVTALFSDLCEYTPLTEELEPEELKDIMDTLFAKSAHIIAAYGGSVEKFVGDGVVALFGLDDMHEHHAVSAIHAAREIHGFAREIAGESYPCLGRGISMHTGINTGLVLVDQQWDDRNAHGALGTPINIASRLSALAGPDDILIGETVMTDAARHFTIEGMGKKRLKGVREPMRVFRVLSAREVPVGIHRQGGITSGLIGRKKELAALVHAFDNLLEGKGSAVCIHGDPGVGKSRLIHEFRKQVPKRTRWIHAQCLDHTKDTPYCPITGLARALLGIREGRDSREEVEEKIRAFSSDMRHSASLISLCNAQASAMQVMPGEWKAGICDAFSWLIRSAGTVSPLVVCIEDIHWADRSTLDLLEYLFQDREAAGSCLFLISTRAVSELIPVSAHIGLNDLDRTEVAAMLGHMLEGNRIPEAAVTYLYRETGGNPFYIEEVVNYLFEKGISLSQCAHGEIPGGVPSTIQGLIAARLLNLGAELKTLLQEASVIGKVFPKTLLAAVSTRQTQFDAGLWGLQEAGFIHESESGEYRFRHALTQEVAYQTQLKRHRMMMHKKVGRALERMGRAPGDICDMLAYHFDCAGEKDLAIQYSIMAARKYQAEGAWVEAAAHYRIAEKWLLVTAEADRDREGLAAVWEGIWSCARILDPNLAVRALESLRGHHARSGASRGEAFVLIRLINLYSQKGLFKEALDTFEQALESAGDDGILRSAAQTAVAYTYTYLGRPDVSLGYLNEARPALGTADRFLLAVNHLTTLTAYVWKGAVQEAMAWYSQTKDLCGDYLDLELMAEIYLGYLHYLRGDFPRARQVFELVHAQERKLGSLAGGLSYLRIQSSIYFNARYTGELDRAGEELRMFEALDNGMKGFPALISLYRAWIAVEKGQCEQARDLLMMALPVFEEGIANRVPYALNVLAEALETMGDTEGAERVALKGIAWNELNGNQDQLVWALRIMGRLYLRQEMFDETRDALKRASFLARACSMRPHTAWTLESWGDYFRSTGQAKRADACYHRAVALWRGMANPYQAGKLSSRIINTGHS